MNTRIVDLTALTAPSSGSNVLLIVDTSDTTLSPQGTDKQISITNVAAYLASLTQILTNKTFDTAGTGNVFKVNGTTINAKTGTGSVVLASSPTLVTPALGVATATSINGVTVPVASDTAALLATSQAFTNKDLTDSSNKLNLTGLIKTGTTVLGSTQTTASTSYGDVTGFSVSITTLVTCNILVIASGEWGNTGTHFNYLQILRGATVISQLSDYQAVAAGTQVFNMSILDTSVAAGTYTYKGQMKVDNGTGSMTGGASTAENSRIMVIAYPN